MMQQPVPWLIDVSTTHARAHAKRNSPGKARTFNLLMSYKHAVTVRRASQLRHGGDEFGRKR